VRLLAGDQISPAATLGITGADSTLDLNGFNQDDRALRLTAGQVKTGVGTLTLAGNVTSLAEKTTALIGGSCRWGEPTEPSTWPTDRPRSTPKSRRC